MHVCEELISIIFTHAFCYVRLNALQDMQMKIYNLRWLLLMQLQLPYSIACPLMWVHVLEMTNHHMI